MLLDPLLGIQQPCLAGGRVPTLQSSTKLQYKDVKCRDQMGMSAARKGVEQMLSKAHQRASGRIAMHQLCFALQSLFLQTRHNNT